MNKLIVSLDIDDFVKASQLIDVLSSSVSHYKVGIAPFVNFGDKLLKKLADKKVFLDLKFHDIPNTVKNATQAAARRGVFMMNVHCLGGTTPLAHFPPERDHLGTGLASGVPRVHKATAWGI